MRICQNGHYQQRNAYDQAQFLVCTHKAPPPAQAGTGAARPPAPRLNILYCHGTEGLAVKTAGGE